MRLVSSTFFAGFFFLLFTFAIFAEDTPKSLVVMLDGVRADGQRMATTPNIDSLMDGSWAPGYKGAWSFFTSTIRDAPTESAPNHTAIATGVSAGKHQVKSNGVFNDYIAKKADEVYLPYLSRIKQSDPKKKLVFLYSWEPDQIITKNSPCDLSMHNSDRDNAKIVPQILAGNFELPGKWAKGADIDVMLFYIDVPDAAGHAGGFSPPGTKHEGYLKSIETCDKWIGDALEAIKKRPNFANEDWMIVICSDHGGWIGSHSGARADNYTLPLVISSKNIVSGKMPGQASTVDIAPTVLDHYGIDLTDLKRRNLIDGAIRGKTAAVPVSDLPLENGLIIYMPFESNVDNKAESKTPSTIKPENKSCEIKTSGGKKGGYLEIRPANPLQCLSLGSPAAMQFGADRDFSCAFWIRMPEKQESDPVILGNKDWKSGKNPGVCLFVNGEGNGGGNNIGLNLADEARNRIDVKQFNIAPGEWWFCAFTVDRKGSATLYAGSPGGKLFFGSMSLAGEAIGVDEQMQESINSSLPWNIGQDGTGKYPALNADLDEFRIWERALSMEEIEKLYKSELND